MKRVTLSTLEKFIRHALHKKLRSDMGAFKILKEADVECCSYFHLRKFIGTDQRWHVFARKHSIHTRFYTDLMIYKSHEPMVAIDIKWRKKKMPKKDRNSLNAALNEHRVRKVYFFSAIPNGIYNRLIKKTKTERYRLFECVVHLGFAGKNRDRKIAEYELGRKKFRV